jgi:hypothetical protein
MTASFFGPAAAVCTPNVEHVIAFRHAFTNPRFQHETSYRWIYRETNPSHGISLSNTGFLSNVSPRRRSLDSEATSSQRPESHHFALTFLIAHISSSPKVQVVKIMTITVGINGFGRIGR